MANKFKQEQDISSIIAEVIATQAEHADGKIEDDLNGVADALNLEGMSALHQALGRAGIKWNVSHSLEFCTQRQNRGLDGRALVNAHIEGKFRALQAALLVPARDEDPLPMPASVGTRGGFFSQNEYQNVAQSLVALNGKAALVIDADPFWIVARIGYHEPTGQFVFRAGSRVEGDDRDSRDEVLWLDEGFSVDDPT